MEMRVAPYSLMTASFFGIRCSPDGLPPTVYSTTFREVKIRRTVPISCRSWSAEQAGGRAAANVDAAKGKPALSA